MGSDFFPSTLQVWRPVLTAHDIEKYGQEIAGGKRTASSASQIHGRLTFGAWATRLIYGCVPNVRIGSQWTNHAIATMLSRSTSVDPCVAAQWLGYGIVDHVSAKSEVFDGWRIGKTKGNRAV